MAKQPSPDPQRMETLYERTQSDPQFFHDLVWNTEKLLPALDFLTRQEKAALLAMEPAELLQQLTAARIPVTEAADNCTGFTCGGTCAGSCDVSCTVTCGITGDRLVGTPTTLPVENPPYLDFVANFQRTFNQFRR